MMQTKSLVAGTWSERWQEASFRGVKFLTESLSTEVGRRTIVHEYPYQDTPSTEDLGGKARKYTLNAYIIGDDHDLRRNALIQAIETAGPGDLIHPEYGLQSVIVVDSCPFTSDQQQRITKFTLNFAQAGQTMYGEMRRNVAADLVTTHSTFTTAITERLATVIQSGLTVAPLKNQTSQVQKAYKQSGLTLATSNGLPNGLTGELILKPSQAAPVLHTALLAPVVPNLPYPPSQWTQLAHLPRLRTSAIYGGLAVLNQLYEVLLPTDHLLQHLQPALLGLAMVNTVRVAYESVEEAMNLRQTLHAQLLKTVALIETPLAVVPDKVAHLLPLQIMSVINVLRDLLVLVDNAAEQQLNTLPHVYYVELKSELPALVLAWREYQLMSQFDALQQRNPHVIHPLFISTHKLVEVLK